MILTESQDLPPSNLKNRLQGFTRARFLGYFLTVPAIATLKRCRRGRVRK